MLDIKLLVLPIVLSQSVIRIVETAFSDVQLGSGVGLKEARAFDDYASEEERLKVRRFDEKEDWRKIEESELLKYPSTLSFFDAEGMRFHLPAFMLSEKYRKSCDSVLYHLTDRGEYSKEQFSLLNSSQRLAVREYLIWCLKVPEYEFEADEINYALEFIWNEN